MTAIALNPSKVKPGASFTATVSGVWDGKSRDVSIRIGGVEATRFTVRSATPAVRTLAAPAAIGSHQVSANAMTGCAQAALTVEAIVVEPPPVDPPPPTGTTREAKSIAELLSMLGDEAISAITMEPKVWVAPNTLMLSNIRRTKPVVVKPTTPGQIVLDGQGNTGIGIRFHNGTSGIEFEDVVLQNRLPYDTGAWFFDGTLNIPAAHHIALRRCGVRGMTAHNERNDHGVYISYSQDGSHDVVIDDMTIDGGSALTSPPSLSSGIHFYHSAPGNVNAHDWLIRRLKTKNCYSHVIIWDSTVRRIVFEDLRATGVVKANGYNGNSVRLERIPAGSGIRFVRSVLEGGTVYSSDGSDQRVAWA